MQFFKTIKLTFLSVLISLSVSLSVTNQALAQNKANSIEMNHKHILRTAASDINFDKPDFEKIKKLLEYYKLTDKDKAEIDEMLLAIGNLNIFEWQKLLADSSLQSLQMFNLAINPSLEESPVYTSEENLVYLPESYLNTLPEATRIALGDFIKTPSGEVLYSKQIAQTINQSLINSPDFSSINSIIDESNNIAPPAPILIGGGFPFNQTQFVDFNKRLSQISKVDLYDLVCTGMSVLYDGTANEGQGCKPYQAKTPLIQLQDEIAFKLAYNLILHSTMALNISSINRENAIFRLTRLSFKGVTLIQQAQALVSLNHQRNNKKGEAILAGISYGGLVAAKLGALYPGQFKALVLFSPGIENSAHFNSNRDFSALMENSFFHRRAIKNMIKDIALSPRYDAYLPDCLKDFNLNFRDSLQSKMLGELDMDIRSDLSRIQDRVFMISGGQDAAINPKIQIDAMKIIFKKKNPKGSYILIPKGGHALWGNPSQSSENAVIRSLEEIQKGEKGVFQDGGVYLWSDEEQSFSKLGEGLQGLSLAEVFIDKMNAKK